MNLKIMKSVVKGNYIRPEISTISVKNGIAIGTDLERSVITKTDYQDGLYDLNGNLLKEAVMINGKSYKVNQDDFPDIKPIEKSNKIAEYNSNELLDILTTNYNFIGSKDSLSVNGIRFANKEIVSTNTYAMAVGNISSEIKEEITINEETIKCLIAVLKENKNSKVILYKEDNKCLLEINDIYILGRTIDLAFPDYKSILEHTTYDKSIKVSNKELVKELKEHLKINKDNEIKYALKLILSKNKLELISINKAMIEKKSELIITCEDSLRITLNNKFLLDFLKNTKDKEINIDLSDKMNPILITTNNYRFMSMPLAISEMD